MPSNAPQLSCSLVLVSVFWMGCPVAPSTEDPCVGQSCSGHGLCAVAASKALCVCDAGFHQKEGSLACEADVAGAECTGVMCSGHGSCVVVDGAPKRPLCQCEAGYDVMGSTTCVARASDPCAGVTCSGHGRCASLEGGALCLCDAPYVAAGPSCLAPDSGVVLLVDGGRACRSAADCAAGEACSTSGACIAKSGAVCGVGPASAGTAPTGATCGTVGTNTVACVAGDVCVPFRLQMNVSTGVYEPISTVSAGGQGALSGRCAVACDPCVAGSCAAGAECISLQGGGGFCAPAGGLLKEGDVCQIAGFPVGYCASGLTCSGAFGTGVCQRYCRPPETEWSRPSFSSYPSSDCFAGTVCTLTFTSSTHLGAVCVPGVLQPTGASCGNPAKPLAVCASPDRCMNAVLNQTPVPGLCGTDCTSCPVGTRCRQFAAPYSPVCGAPGEVGVGGVCLDDTDCSPPNTCKPLGSNTQRVCRP